MYHITWPGNKDLGLWIVNLEEFLQNVVQICFESEYFNINKIR